MDKPIDKKQNKVNYGSNRKQTYIIPKRGIIHRHPMIYIWLITFSGLGIFFSRPIYDAFFRKYESTDHLTKEQRRQLVLDSWRI